MAHRWRQHELNGIALIAAGFALVALVTAGYYIGTRIDQAFGTGTRWSVVGLIAGLLVGFWELYVVAARILATQPSFTPRPVTDETDNDQDEGQG